MINPDLAKKLRRLEIVSRKAVNDSLAGEYHSCFKGRGMAFDEVREYQPGDEVRLIDWNVTARMGHPFIKRFIEERELTIFLLVDLSASGAFGSIGRWKKEVATELCALLAFSALKNHDKAGLIAFTETVELMMPPAKGASHVARMINRLLRFKPRRTRTSIQAGIACLDQLTAKPCVVFLISDFFAPDFELPLRVLARRHDVIALAIADPRELSLPDAGLVELEDAETGELIEIDTGSAAIRREYASQAARGRESLRRLFNSIQVDHVEVRTDRDYARELVRFFRARQRRARR